MTDLLVTVSMRFPTLDRDALATHLTSVVQAAIAAGGTSTSISVQEYDDEESGDDD